MTLDEKYERFAQLVFSGMPDHEAYLEVGYPKGSSYKANARRLSHHPKVKARVKELQSQAAACMVIDAAWLRSKVARLAGFEIELSKLKASDVIAAQALFAKMIPEALVPQKIAPTNPEGDSAYDPGEITDEQRIAAFEAFLAKVKRKTEAA